MGTENLLLIIQIVKVKYIMSYNYDTYRTFWVFGKDKLMYPAMVLPRIPKVSDTMNGSPVSIVLEHRGHLATVNLPHPCYWYNCELYCQTGVMFENLIMLIYVLTM